MQEALSMWGIFQKSSSYLRFKHKDNRWLPQREKNTESMRERDTEREREGIWQTELVPPSKLVSKDSQIHCLVTFKLTTALYIPPTVTHLTSMHKFTYALSKCLCDSNQISSAQNGDFEKSSWSHLTVWRWFECLKSVLMLTSIHPIYFVNTCYRFYSELLIHVYVYLFILFDLVILIKIS